MRARWKLLGLAGVAGVAATGVVVARQRRDAEEYTPEELRDRLPSRLSATQAPAPAPGHGGVAVGERGHERAVDGEPGDLRALELEVRRRAGVVHDGGLEAEVD